MSKITTIIEQVKRLFRAASPRRSAGMRSNYSMCEIEKGRISRIDYEVVPIKASVEVPPGIRYALDAKILNEATMDRLSKAIGKELLSNGLIIECNKESRPDGIELHSATCYVLKRVDKE